MSSDLETELRALRAMVEAQEERAEAQQARIAELERAAIAPGPGDGGPSASLGSISRRALFGAGAGIVGATVLGSAAPAAADDGDAVLLGRDNTTAADTPTVLEHSNASAVGGSAFVVSLTDPAAEPTAITGITAGTGTGVAGQSVSGIGVTGSAGAGAPAVYGNNSSENEGAGAGVEGEAEVGHGVVGRSTAGFGVEAASDSNFGLNAFSAGDSAINADNDGTFPTITAKNAGTGIGVEGRSDSGIGIAASSESGPIGLLATAEGPGPAVAGVFDSSLGAGIRMTPRTDLTGPPTSGSYLIGSQLVDSEGDVYACTQSGIEGGTWARLNTAPGVTFLAAPERAYDSRPGGGPGIKGKIASGTTRVVDLTAGTAVPVGAAAAFCNVTITDTEGGGFISVYSADEPTATPPSFASVNSFASGQTIGNNVQTAMSTTGDVKVYASRSVHVIVDVVAYIA